MNEIKQLMYSLGCGCWCYSAIPERLRSPSVFEQCGGIREDIFLPQTLFDGRLESLLFRKDAWKLKFGNHRPDDGEYIYDIQADIPEIGFRIGHINATTRVFLSLTNQAEAQARFKFFKDNKHSQLFIVDFTRGYYQLYTNQMIHEFEEHLELNGFNLDNFIYADVDQRKVPNRFDECKIKLFHMTTLIPTTYRVDFSRVSGKCCVKKETMWSSS